MKLPAFKMPKWNLLARAGLHVLLLSLGALTLVACFDAAAGLPYVVSWFRFQYFLALCVIGAVLLVMRDWRWVAAAASFNAINLWFLAPYIVPWNAQHAEAHSAQTLTLCQMNVNYGNIEYWHALNYIKKVNPDVILIEELKPGWSQVLREQLRQYSFVSEVQRKDAFGIGLFSKLPIHRSSSVEFQAGQIPYTQSTILLGDKEVNIVHLHVYPVLNQGLFVNHKKQMDELVNVAASMQQPLIMLGDFNSPIWSSTMNAIMRAGNLRSASVGRGWQPTWPKQLWPRADGDSPLMMVPIDHCLVARDISVEKFEVGPVINSDHAPVAVTLKIPR